MATSSIAAALPVLNLFYCGPSPSPRLSLSFPPRTSTRKDKTFALSASASRNSFPPMGGASRTGLLERPSLDQSQFDPIPQPQQGGNMGHLRDKTGLQYADSYRVLLIDDACHNEKLVEKALPQVVPSVTVNDAIELFRESRREGAAVVIVTVKEHAEFYADMMIRCGLRSAIEPDSNMA